MSNYGDGVQQVNDLIEMLRVQGLSSKVMAASLHNTNQVHELIKAGIQAITFPPCGPARHDRPPRHQDRR